jgi:hypothetical protein
MQGQLNAALDVRFVFVQHTGSAKDQSAIVHERQRSRNSLIVLGNEQQPALQEKLLHLVIGIDN